MAVRSGIRQTNHASTNCRDNTTLHRRYAPNTHPATNPAGPHRLRPRTKLSFFTIPTPKATPHRRKAATAPHRNPPQRTPGSVYARPRPCAPLRLVVKPQSGINRARTHRPDTQEALFIPFACLTTNAHFRQTYLSDFCEIPCKDST